MSQLRELSRTEMVQIEGGFTWRKFFHHVGHAVTRFIKHAAPGVLRWAGCGVLRYFGGSIGSYGSRLLKC